MSIEDNIRQVQAEINEIKAEKSGMQTDMSIVELIINDTWKQDIIEKIRDNYKGVGK